MGSLGTPSCAPGKAFCDAQTLWSCTRSGADAALLTDCTGGTPNNPDGCFTTECPAGASACCRATKATCRWVFTRPAVTGATYGTAYDAAQGSCTAYASCSELPLTVYLALPVDGSTCAAVAHRYLHVAIARPFPALGQAVALPREGLSLSLSEPGTSCSTWTGTLTVDSDVPGWKLTVDATCSEPGKASVRLVGVLNGDS